MKTLTKKLEALLGTGWTIESDNGFNPISLKSVILKTYLQDDEKYIIGETVLARKGEDKLLNAECFFRLWENQHLIPEAWKEKTNGNTTYIFFDGTVVRSPYGRRFSLCLYWLDGRWDWGYGWLDDRRRANDPSAVLASKHSALKSSALHSEPGLLGLEQRVEALEAWKEKVEKWAAQLAPPEL